MNLSIAGRKRKFPYRAPILLPYSSESETDLPLIRGRKYLPKVSNTYCVTDGDRENTRINRNAIPNSTEPTNYLDDGDVEMYEDNDLDDGVVEMHEASDMSENESLLNDPRRIESEAESDDGSENGFPLKDIAVDDYNTILEELTRQWLLIEIDQNVSKACSDSFWNLAQKWFPRLQACKEKQRIKRKTPQFTHIRRKMYHEKTPKVHLDIAYKNKETGEVEVIEDVEKIPVNKYPPNKFTKLYESASVHVSQYRVIIM